MLIEMKSEVQYRANYSDPETPSEYCALHPHGLTLKVYQTTATFAFLRRINPAVNS